MKRIIAFFAAVMISLCAFAETNANDTQAAIVNALLIQQMMQQQQQQNQQAQQQVTEQPKKTTPESEEDLLAAGYKRFKIDEDAEDNLVFKSKAKLEYEIEVWAVNKANKVRYYGTVVVNGKKGYKGNPLDDDLDNYKAVWLKITNDENATIKSLGEKFSDQVFEIN